MSAERKNAERESQKVIPRRFVRTLCTSPPNTTPYASSLQVLNWISVSTPAYTRDPFLGVSMVMCYTALERQTCRRVAIEPPTQRTFFAPIQTSFRRLLYGRPLVFCVFSLGMAIKGHASARGLAMIPRFGGACKKERLETHVPSFHRLASEPSACREAQRQDPGGGGYFTQRFTISEGCYRSSRYLASL